MNNKTNVTYPNMPYAFSDCPICDQLAAGYCAINAQGGPMPIPGDEGSIYLGGQVIWPGIAPACGSD